MLKNSSYRRGSLAVLAVVNALYAFAFFQRVAVPGTIFDQLQSDIGLSAAGVAMMGGIFLYVYGTLQVVAGALIDRFGPGRVAVWGGLLLSLGAILFPLSSTPWVLYLCRLLVGIGSSVTFLVLLKEIDIQVSGRNFSAILSVGLFIGYSGGLVATKPFALAVEAFGWRSVLLWVGIGSGVVTIASAVIIGRWYSYNAQCASRDVLPALVRVLRNRRCYPILYAYSVLFGIYSMMMTTLGKKLLEDTCSLSSGRAAAYTFSLMLTVMCASFASGVVSRLIGNRRRPLILIGGVLAIAACAAMFPVIEGRIEWAMTAYVLLGSAMMCMPIYVSVMKETNEPEYAGLTSGVLNLLIFLMTALLTTMSGIILDRYAPEVHGGKALHYPPEAYKTIFAVCLLLAVSAFITSFRVIETCGRNISRSPSGI